MPRRLTGFTPSGTLHLGNYAGAIRPIIAEQASTETVVFISDLTLGHEPAQVRRRTLEFATVLLAAGADPGACLFLVQSHVPEHTELHYLLECARDLACRFNTRYGHTFTVPRAVNPPVAARIMDLAAPGQKMSKSASTAAGALRLLDEPDVLRRKVIRAVTDSGSEVVYDPARKPGTSNLLAILASCTGDEPERLAPPFDRYGELKAATADAVVATLEPVRERYAELARDPHYVQAVLRAGATRAHEQASEKVWQAKAAIGLLAPMGSELAGHFQPAQ